MVIKTILSFYSYSERSIHTKIKRIIKAAATLLLAAAISVSSAITASATWIEHGAGNCQSGKIGSYPLGYGGNNLSWRVNLYVSTRADGSIDPQTTNIAKQSGAALVGSIIFTQANLSGTPIYIQNQHDSALTRSSSIATTTVTYSGRTIYDLPTLKPWDDSTIVAGLMGKAGQYYTSLCLITGSTSMFKEAGLPSSIDTISSLGYNKAVKEVIERTAVNSEGKSYNQFIDVVVTALQAYSPPSSDFLTNILKAIHPDVKSKLVALHEEGYSDMEVYSHIYPSSTDPLLGWIATVEPLFSFKANSKEDAAGIQYTNAFVFTPTSYYAVGGDNPFEGRYYPTVWYTGRENSSCILMMDSFAASQYNTVTRQMFLYNGVNDYLYYSCGVTIDNATAEKYSEKGQLRKEYGSTIFSNVASAAYVDEPTSTYYGIYTSTSSTSWDDGTMHLKGGITVVNQPLDDPDIPIYTHTYTYTPGNPNPTIFTSQTDTVPPTQAYISVDSAHR